jgi:hypothetical protein
MKNKHSIFWNINKEQYTNSPMAPMSMHAKLVFML